VQQLHFTFDLHNNTILPNTTTTLFSLRATINNQLALICSTSIARALKTCWLEARLFLVILRFNHCDFSDNRLTSLCPVLVTCESHCAFMHVVPALALLRHFFYAAQPFKRLWMWQVIFYFLLPRFNLFSKLNFHSGSMLGIYLCPPKATILLNDRQLPT